MHAYIQLVELEVGHGVAGGGGGGGGFGFAFGGGLPVKMESLRFDAADGITLHSIHRCSFSAPFRWIGVPAPAPVSRPAPRSYQFCVVNWMLRFLGLRKIKTLNSTSSLLIHPAGLDRDRAIEKHSGRGLRLATHEVKLSAI